jgi:hypothetical protein
MYEGHPLFHEDRTTFQAAGGRWPSVHVGFGAWGRNGFFAFTAALLAAAPVFSPLMVITQSENG